MNNKNKDDFTEEWLRQKFNSDLSDIRREVWGYYKFYVQNFINSYFTKIQVDGKRILDFGCGPGYYSAILGQLGATIIGIEKNKYLIKKAIERKKKLKLDSVDFYHSDIKSYSQSNDKGKFDYILAIDTIVSLDYGRNIHNHKEVVEVFHEVRKLLKDKGVFFIIESHPFFGQLFMAENSSSRSENYYKSTYSYKIEHNKNNFPHHWFTLDEMSKATNECGLVIQRIREPDPSKELKKEDCNMYAYRLKHPAMIVYEISKLNI